MIINSLKKAWCGEEKLWKVFLIWLTLQIVMIVLLFGLRGNYLLSVIYPILGFAITLVVSKYLYNNNILKEFDILKNTLVFLVWLLYIIVTIACLIWLFVVVLSCKAGNGELCVPIL